MASLDDALQNFCEQHGKSEDEILQLLQQKHATNADVKKMVVQHVIKDESRKTIHRRKLRLFSGKIPTPPGEATFDVWRVSARQLIDDPDLIDPDKKRSITDSLLMPALNVVRNESPGTPAKVLVDKLTKVYGASMTADDMMLDFHEICQKEEETASDYLQRLHTELMYIADNSSDSPPSPADIKKYLLRQFLRGCFDDDIIQRLKLEDLTNPLEFDVFYQKLRTAEMRRTSKQKRMTNVSKGKKKPYQHHHQGLHSDGATHDSTEDLAISQRSTDNTTTRIAAMEERLEALTSQIATLASQLQQHEPTQQKKETPRQRRSGMFCYNCGEDNHHMRNCQNEKNPVLVQEKMIARQNANQHNVPQTQRNPVQHHENSATRKDVIPELLGPRYESYLYLNGTRCKCLIDTGAQPSIITESYLKTMFPSLEVHPLTNIVSTEGSGGHITQYSGYIVVDVQFPEELDPERTTFSIPILVGNDTTYSQTIPLIVGTNILRKLGTIPQLFNKKAPLPQSDFVIAFRTVLIPTSNEEGSLGNLGPLSKTTIDPGYTGIIPVKLRNISLEKQTPVLVQQSTKVQSGLIVKEGVMNMSTTGRINVPVVNISDRPIQLDKHTKLAEVSVPDSIVPATSAPTDLPSIIDEIDIGPVPAEWKPRITSMIRDHINVFSQNDLDLGGTDAVKHRIQLTDETPFKERSRPVAPHDFEDLRQHLKELLEMGVIRESQSPYASPIVITRKKSGKIRMVIDYRRLNNRTIKDSYNLPKIEDILTSLSGAKWFSTLDLKSGYYQIEMHEDDKEKTAFACPLGFYEFNKLPQGVVNAPATFQRFMEKTMADMMRRGCMVFLDDLVIYSDTLQNHEERLRMVFERLAKNGLKLSPSKCKLYQTKVSYLGHLISQDGIATDPEKIETLKSWPIPRNSKDLHSFLGFTSFYRKYVKHYSQVAEPLQNLLTWCNQISSNKKRARKIDLQPHWKDEHQESFDKLISLLTSAPILAYADYTLPYELHTDASLKGLGAILYQNQEGNKRVIAYASRRLSKTEKNYPAHKLEFLAMKWAITDKFKDYLYNSSFKVITDNNPLTYVMKSARLDAVSSRWVSALSPFNFTIHYKAGYKNKDADMLSRKPKESDSSLEDSDQQADLLNRIQNPHIVQISTLISSHNHREDHNIAMVETISSDPDVIPATYETPPGSPIQQMTSRDWKYLQHRDSDIRQLIQSILSNSKPSRNQCAQMSPDLKALYREWEKYTMQDEVLYRKVTLTQFEHNLQLVLPRSHRDQAFKGLHEETGHLGYDRTLEFMRSRFYYPRMADDIRSRIQKCERCIRRKTLPQNAAKMHHLESSGPMDLVCIDFLKLDPDSQGYENVLVVTDHFTRLAQAFVTRNQKAETVAKLLWENVFQHYGFPRILHSDNAKDFEAKVIKQLCKLTGITKTHCSPYHPKGNSQVERFNQTLINMIGTLPKDKKRNWRKYVPSLVHAYNCSRNDATGHSPFYMMFGRQARLPIDIAMGVNPDQHTHKDHIAYVKSLKERLEHAYKQANRRVHHSKEYSKSRHDARVVELNLTKGDRVLVRNVGLQGRNKLADRWASDVYIVKDQPDPELPVYIVYPEKSPKKVRTLHRDLLLPCGSIPISDGDEHAPRNRHRNSIATRGTDIMDQGSVSSDSMERFDLPHESTSQDDSSPSSPSSEPDTPVIPRRSSRVRRAPDRLHFDRFGTPVNYRVTSDRADLSVYWN